MIVAGSFIKHLKEKAKKKEKKKEIISLRPNTVNAKFFSPVTNEKRKQRECRVDTAATKA